MPATEQTLRELCESALDRRAFYDAFLKYAAAQTGAVSGVAWNCGVLPFRPVAQIQSPDFGTFRVGISESDHFQLLRQTAETKKSLLVLPRPDVAGVMPVDHSVILVSPVQRESDLELVELFLPPGASNTVYQTKLRELESLCQAVAALNPGVEWEDLVTPADSAVSPFETKTNQSSAPARLNIQSKLDDYVHRIHGSLDLKDTAAEIANELRRVLDCDRVSVVLAKKNQAKILSISGQPTVNSRSNTVQGLRRVVESVLPLGSTFWYPSEELLPEQITKPLNSYLVESTTRTMIVEPIFDRAAVENPDPQSDPVARSVIGGIVIEHSQSEWSRDRISAAIETTTRHAADAFRNSYQHRQLLFYPIWKWLGKTKLVAAARNLRIATAALIGLTLISLLLAFYPAEFRLNCEGQLVPKNRHNVFAEIDGTVVQVLVKHGDAVAAGQSMLKIENHDFKYQQQELVGQIEELEQTIISLASQRLTNRSAEEKQNRQQNQQALEAELASLGSQLKLVEKKLAQLTISSPSAGKVVTWNLIESLQNRPVSRGEILLEVADVEGEWELELSLSDRKVGHFLEAYRKQGERNRESSESKPLAVDFLLAADPSQRFHGTVKQVGSATEIDPVSGQTIRISVAIDASDFDIRQVKSGVSAQIHCGRRSLGYVWFHPVWEFIQAKILFPFVG